MQLPPIAKARARPKANMFVHVSAIINIVHVSAITFITFLSTRSLHPPRSHKISLDAHLVIFHMLPPVTDIFSSQSAKTCGYRHHFDPIHISHPVTSHHIFQFLFSPFSSRVSNESSWKNMRRLVFVCFNPTLCAVMEMFCMNIFCEILIFQPKPPSHLFEVKVNQICNWSLSRGQQGQWKP